MDTDRALERSIRRIESHRSRVDAIVVTGDLADRGEPEAYDRVSRLLAPLADRLGAELLWVMGNHDERAAFSEGLYGRREDAVQDRVVWREGLRLIALDSTVPGYHHGEIDEAQLEWLRDELAHPAPAGTILALHHPPLASPVRLMGLLELRNVAGLEEVIRATDVRAILAGHLHYPTFGTFAGVPVSVASATCYTIDPLPGQDRLVGVDSDQAFSLVEVFEDNIVHSVVSAFAGDPVSEYSPESIEALERMDAEERDEAFSRKR